MKKWIDLTVLIDDDFMPYPGDKKIEIEVANTVEKDGYNLKRIKTGMHMGTHLDVKKHIFDVESGIEAIDINNMIGKARVIRPKITNNIIDVDSINEIKIKDEKILIFDLIHADKLNTKAYYNQPKFTPDIMDYLLKNHIKVVGFDMPSPEYIDGHFLDMHRDLLSNNIIIIENLTNLNQLSDQVEFIALPLKIKGLDGSMIRCVAKNI